MVVFLQFLGPQNFGKRKTVFIDFMSSKDCVVKFMESWIIQRQNFWTPVRQSITSRHRTTFLSIHISRRTGPPLSHRKPAGDISSSRILEVQIINQMWFSTKISFSTLSVLSSKNRNRFMEFSLKKEKYSLREYSIVRFQLESQRVLSWTLSHVPCILLSLFSHKIKTHRSVKLICSKTDDPIFAFQVPDIDFRLWKEGNICSNK